MRPLTLLLVTLLLPFTALAVGPSLTLNHHGSLLGVDDAPVNGSLKVVVKIWNDATALQESAILWQDTWTSVSFSQGRYAILLGDTSANQLALSAEVFAKQVFIGFTFGDEPELSPRLKVSLVPTAARALLAEKAQDSDKLGGASLAELDARYAPASGGGYAQLQQGSTPTPQSGSLSLDGTVAATAITGDGSGLTALSASAITTGKLPDAAFSGPYTGALALQNAANTFDGTFNGTHTGIFNGTVEGTIKGNFTGRLVQASASAAPACGADARGSVYFGTDDGALHVCDGTAWRGVGARPARLRWSQLTLDLDLIGSKQQQSLTLTNDGDVAAAGLNLAIAGGFTKVEDCGATLAAGASCTVSFSLPTSGQSVRRTGTAIASATGVTASQPLALAGTYFPLSCKQAHLDVPAAGSGLFTIDSDGLFGRAPFQVYCDMATDGGGWTILIKHPVDATTQDPLSDYGTLTDGLDGNAYSTWSKRSQFTYTEVLYRPTYDARMFAVAAGRALKWMNTDGSTGSLAATTDVNLAAGASGYSGYFGLGFVQFPPSGWCSHTGYIFGLPGGDPHGCHYDAWYWTWGAPGTGASDKPVAGQAKTGRALIGIR